MSINRAALILVIAVLGSSCFGLLDPLNFAVKGVFDNFLLFVLLFGLLSLISLKEFGRLQQGIFVWLVWLHVLLWVLGVLLPIIKGYSTAFFALKASKEFLMILAYFAVFLFIRTQQEVEQAWRFVFIWSAIYSCIELAAQLLGASMWDLLTYALRPEPPFFWKIYPPFWIVILVTFLHLYYELALGLKSRIALLGLAFMGLILTFFRSYLLATFVVVPALLFLAKQGVVKTMIRISTFVAGSLICIVLASLMFGGGLSAVEKLADDFVFSAIRELQDQTGGSLAGRAVFAEEREKILEKSPYTGFGFIEKQSDFGRSVSKHLTGDMLGFIDKGDVDLKLKFGSVGFYFLLLVYVFFIGKAILLVRKGGISPILKVRMLTVASLMTIYLLVLPVHAALTHGFAILPLFICLGLVDRQYVNELRRMDGLKRENGLMRLNESRPVDEQRAGFRLV